MWTGRFKEEMDETLLRFSESLSFDRRLWRQDIDGSLAHAAALLGAGILSQTEYDAIVTGLEEIRREIEAERFVWRTELEDVHMNIERSLTERIGTAGAKLHTARSRNDQVALDLRMYCRQETAHLVSLLKKLQFSLIAFAKRHPTAILPGYTHLQRAQPVTLGHHLLAYVEMFERDIDRFQQAAERLNVLPLGSGALAGSTIVLDRELIARQLGFSALSRNSMDAVSDRDFVCDLVYTSALCGVHLSRLGEDVILWASSEFGFIRLSDAFTTGSSLMPQKKNPDAAELARGKTGRLLGNLAALLTMLKGLPLTYNRDLQEDKERLFDSVDTVAIILTVFSGMFDQAGWDEQRSAAAAADPLLVATDLADELVRRGVPFRQAHEIVGRLVGRAAALGVSLDELPPEEFKAAHSSFDGSEAALLNAHQSLARRVAVGAPAPKNVEAELVRWTSQLAGQV